MGSVQSRTSATPKKSCKIDFSEPENAELGPADALLDSLIYLRRTLLPYWITTRISVSASQALTEANKMGPCLKPMAEAAERCFAYVLILPF
jgi:hypothetical protein